MQFGRAFLLCGIAVGMLGQTKVDLPPPASRKVEFTSDIQPILKKRCEACHGAAQQVSGLRLDQRDAALAGGYSGQVILPGKSGESKLIHRVAGAPGVMVMPPSGPRLTPEEVGFASRVDRFRRGLDTSKISGRTRAPAANKDGHWAFQPIAEPALPAGREVRLRTKSRRSLRPQSIGAREDSSFAGS